MGQDEHKGIGLGSCDRLKRVGEPVKSPRVVNDRAIADGQHCEYMHALNHAVPAFHSLAGLVVNVGAEIVVSQADTELGSLLE